MGELMKEEFEDTKGVIRIIKSKKDRQHNDQKRKDKQKHSKKNMWCNMWSMN
jgi:hypothetical protein